MTTVTKVDGLIAVFPMGKFNVVARECASLDCGCRWWVGMRMDLKEVSTVLDPCDDESHEAMMAEANARLVESLDNPRPVPLIDVLVEILSEVATEGAS